MKELTLLPEDWKGEIDGTKAKFAINEFGQLSNQLPGIGLRYHSDVKYYDIIDGEPVKLTPEPRPTDSIKLSECDGRHIIEMSKSYTARLEGHNFVARNFKGEIATNAESAESLCRHYLASQLKIYDMSA